MDEEDLLHYKFTIQQNDLLKDQNIRFAQIQARNNKLLAKFGLNLKDFKESYQENEFHKHEQKNTPQ